MSQLSREQILKLAKLSRLSLSEDEITRFQKELSSILNYVERLESVDTSGLSPTYQVTGLQNVTRVDESKPQVATPEALMARVPRKKDGYIQVGRMI